MAASSSPRPYSPSESESDREPNSRGARIFWGNLKTPEKSRSSFVDPPQTVVRTQVPQAQARRRSTRFSTPGQVDNSSAESSQDEMEETDHTFNPMNNDITETLPRTLEENDGERACLNHYVEEVDAMTNSRHSTPCSPAIQTVPPVHAILSPPLQSGSESEIEIEGEPVLQPSSVVSSPQCASNCLETLGEQPLPATPQTPLSLPEQHIEHHLPRSSELPDLISFDMPTSSPSNNISKPLSQGAVPGLEKPFSSSCATVDDLLTLSPIPSAPPSQPRALSPLPASQGQSKDVLHDMETFSAPNDELALPHNAVPSVPLVVSDSINTPENLTSLDGSLFPIGHTTVVYGQPNKILMEPHSTPDIPTTPTSQIANLTTHTPNRIPSPLPFASVAETRRRSPMKKQKGKEKADGDGSSGESSTSTSGGCFESSRHGGDDACDKTTKKERRAKSRQDTERTRQQLLSLSPTSAGLLNLLSSPDHNGLPVTPSSNGLDGMVTDLAVQSNPLEGSNQEDTGTLPAFSFSGPRRVPISVSSPQRPEASPFRFVRPAPVLLNDPNRTPARRVLVPIGSKPQPHLLSLDDPDRTPARRVTVMSSPSKSGLTDLSTPTQQVRGESIKDDPEPHMKSPANSTTPWVHDGVASPSSTSILSANVSEKTSHFPVQQNLVDDDMNVMSSSPLPVTSAAAKEASALGLRQPSSVTASKIARAAIKPYSRPGLAPTRLPVTSSIRRTKSNAGASSHSTVNVAGPSRMHTSPGHITPSRIPSPVKRRTLSVEPPLNVPLAASSLTSTDTSSVEDDVRTVTTYKRKRQRMMSEDESDEPPSKRSVIVVRPVIKGMYDKSASRLAASSASTRSLMNTVRPPRPPGSMRIRPVIPGTLRHFETTRSSSRVLLKDEEEDNDANMQAKTLPSTLPTTSSSFMSREETPLIDTDTGSTVTTLSREPTLEISPESPSALRLSTPVPTDSEPERAEPRRTRRPQVSYTSKAPSSSVTSSKGDPTALTRTTTMVQRGGMLSKATPRSTGRSATPLGGLPANPRQLQAITQANTVRNQVYFADLQRKVVRRYGPRPASPTTKVRTIIEKSKEERSKEREARARRRRRDEGSNMTASSDGDYIDAPSSPTSEGLVSRSGPVIKHIRGPGDEEDYETPERPLKPSRIDPNKLAKNVKWDRGLAIKISEWATEQKEDEMREGERVAAVRKGCLARDPATLQLDPLGNVPNAELPLEDLGRERVIVTRFVYDDDVEATRTTKRKKP